MTVDWWQEARDFVVSAILLVLAGAPVGLVWAAAAPTLPLIDALRGSESAFHAEIGADVWFIIVGAAAGALSAAVATVLRREGPGTALGLGLGGLAGAFVADRVAYLAHRGGTLDTLHHLGISLRTLTDAGFDPFFKLRALGVVVAWPLVAVLLHAVVVAVRAQRP